jgi:DsbC/DsbD-like thiol-disulfide interchange protein
MFGHMMLTRLALIFCSLLAFGAMPVGATTQDDVVTAEIVQGWRTDRGSTMMALHLTLTPGWKTYWRSPGDAGIPPVFNWSGSDNLGQVRIHWPRPAVFHTNGMTSIGYHDELVLPFEVFAADPARPIRLDLRMDLGVCKDICLPATLVLDSEVAGKGKAVAAIKAALADQPTSAKAAGLSAISCDIAPIDDGLRVTAHVDMPALGADETVVFEPGAPDIWVAAATSTRQGDRLTAATDMVGQSGAPFALDRSAIVLTIISGSAAVEITGCPAGP